jgi:SAM-dependent methyltransferase
MSSTKKRPDWYREWFGEEYLALYPHRDEDEAREAVDLLVRSLRRTRGPVLDLACGAGRHMREFARRGIAAVGLDLSRTLLRQGKAAAPDIMLAQGDMRYLPFADGSFDLVANFFTSFGYFAEPEDDQRVLNEIRRVLRADGGFMLDFLNAERVRNNLVSEDVRFIDGRFVTQTRRLEDGGRVVVKEIRISLTESGEPINTFYERVRLYSPAELASLLRSAGLEANKRFGDYVGGPVCSDCPRYILLGHAV